MAVVKEMGILDTKLALVVLVESAPGGDSDEYLDNVEDPANTL